ncbi:acetyl-CoA C-acetyltransferase [Dactylosporangium fulvum]|uniref:Acetyl-CoA C-acetyltransferase n=1 Tax=Dactylosporangium fulvum TaxID=53359 RepID=A0ABY5VS16_9ACTN|nr:acetyl-CoA C-acetyltransferase [Dactylosporangium fulvum]UWP78611.1 acetyl-CoA C-acetyltransferase [Dactylosporangium fulvum]
MPDAVIVSAVRSPIGRAYKGSLAGVRADDLAAQIVRKALDKVPALDPATLDDLILGCAQPAGEQGYNLGRQVAMHLGFDMVPGATVNRYCASSLQAIRMAFHAIKAGEGHAFVAAGAEVVSHYPAGRADGMPDTKNPRWPAFAPTDHWSDPRERGELPDVYLAMGETAENVAQLCGVSRHEQDEFAVRSQNNAEKAQADGFWDLDITPVELPDGTVLRRDDGPRPGVTLEKVSALQPVFRPDGTVTAGNCCPLNDGAAALVVMSSTRAAELGLTPLARIVSTGVSALSPEIMGLGPVEATRRALANAGMSIRDIDLVEINEAFAAQVIPSYRQMGADLDKVNVHGGAIAVGHPFGMTGARIATTLLNGLVHKDRQFGLETMCTAGGQGMAMVLERLS